MHYVIIGAGPAGIVAAETLRKNDPDADITIIGEEKEPPYSRMARPYYLIGDIPEEGSYLRDPKTYFKHNNITVVQDQVTAIVNQAHQIKLAHSGSMSYDKLLIASGSRPIAPPIPGTDLDTVHSCWTLDDARSIVKLAQKGSNAVLIGAGFIGSIILESLVKCGVNLTVVETGNRMVPRMLNEKAGGLLKDWCVAQGIDVHTSCSVDAIKDAGDGNALVHLSNGSEIPAQLIITATGVKPNVELLDGSNIHVEQGIVVDSFLQTSDENVYAAGDVAQGLDFSTGETSVQAIQPTATDHGRIAALNMCGQKTHHHGSVNMNVLDTVGLISCSFGLWMGVDGGDSSELYSEKDYKYLNLQFDGNLLVGASCSGLTQHVGALRGLIESQVPLGEWKQRLMQNPYQFMEAYMACTQEIGYSG